MAAKKTTKKTAKPAAKKKTITVQLYAKEPDVWGEVIHALKLSDSAAAKHFEFGGYATLEITIAKDLTFSGRILPV